MGPILASTLLAIAALALMGLGALWWEHRR